MSKRSYRRRKDRPRKRPAKRLALVIQFEGGQCVERRGSDTVWLASVGHDRSPILARDVRPGDLLYVGSPAEIVSKRVVHIDPKTDKEQP